MDIDKQIIDEFEEKVVNHPEVSSDNWVQWSGICKRGRGGPKDN